MKRFVSTATAIGLLLSSAGIAQAAEHAPSAFLQSLSTSTTAVVAPRPGCDSAAAVDGQPYFEMPAIAIQEGATGRTEVRIDLRATGKLSNAALFSSSGDAWLDAAALRSARLTRFSAEMSNCKAQAGSYLYVVEF